VALGLLAAPTAVTGTQAWDLFVMGNRIYFTGDNGHNFHASDGTTGGTVKLFDLPPGRQAHGTQVVGSRAFFVCYDSATTKDELWLFDGTAASMVAPVEPWPLVEIGGTLFFEADDGVHGRELWTSDGSTTRMVKDINPGLGDSEPALLVGNCDSVNHWDDGADRHARGGSATSSPTTGAARSSGRPTAPKRARCSSRTSSRTELVVLVDGLARSTATTSSSPRWSAPKARFMGCRSAHPASPSRT
jgi:ELWxxDGT repeat protein